MTRKINQKQEKRARNEEYAKKWGKTNPEKKESDKRQGGKYGKWCRTPGHPPSCSCLYDI